MRTNVEVRRRCHSCTRMATSTRKRCDDAWGHAHPVSNAEAALRYTGGIKAGAAAQQQASALSDEHGVCRKNKKWGGGWSKRTARSNKDTPTQKKTRDARQDMLHVSSRAVSKQPYIIEIMNQREQARWRTAGGWFAASFLRTACARSPCGSGHGSLLATKCNKVQQSATNQIIVHGRCPHKRSWENARRFHSISQTSTATQSVDSFRHLATRHEQQAI
jgi:hypothetical protein